MNLFNYIKNKQFDELKINIINNTELDLDICDEHYNYLIQYLINYNLIDIVDYIVNNRMIRLDILDTDGRNLLYSPIKYNYIELLKILIKADNKNIGISILSLRDKMGYTGLYYSILFNNFEAVKLLYKNESDISIIDNKGNNIFMFALEYKRTDMFLYLFENELKNKIDTYDYINNKNESILQNAIIYDNTIVLDYFMNKNIMKNIEFIKKLVNNMEKEYGLTALHQCIILGKNDYAIKLLEYNADINISDYIGNTPIHYAVIEKNFEFIEYIKKNNIDITFSLNCSNMNGDTPLHLLLELDEIDCNVADKERYKYNYLMILLMFIEKTNINIQNNMGITSLYIMISKKLYNINSIVDILTNGETHMNIFISNKENQTIYDIIMMENTITIKKIIDIVINSYYNILLKYNKIDYTVMWEKYCANNDIKNLLLLYRKEHIKKEKNKDIIILCKDYIENMIVSKQRSIPLYNDININIEYGIFKNGCYYIGSAIDILCGLIYLYTKFNNMNIVIEYPLIENAELETYYKTIGLNYTYKLDFSNIEIIWSFQKLITLTNFDNILINKIKNINEKQFIVIPLGIEVTNGSHANIIIIDMVNNIIERFEPNGKHFPRGFYYNPDILDIILENKFINLLKKIGFMDFIYMKPSDFLPTIGFQMLETIEDTKCNKIGDPNGFCAIWCVWWAEQRLTYFKIKSNILANQLINKIKLSNHSFKNLIRNYSMNIINIRDEYLNKYDLDINDWITNNYKDSDIIAIERDIVKIL